MKRKITDRMRLSWLERDHKTGGYGVMFLDNGLFGFSDENGDEKKYMRLRSAIEWFERIKK